MCAADISLVISELRNSLGVSCFLSTEIILL